MQRESTSTFDFAMGLRHAALACLALLSTTRGQYINAVDDSVDSYLVAFGVADCIDAMIAINENSVDTTTIGDDATRTIEGYVSPPTDTTVTGADSILYYTATVTRDTSYAVTTLAIPEICTFQFSCSEYEAQNFSCTYDLILTEPSFNVNESFYAVATDNEDLATTWRNALASIISDNSGQYDNHSAERQLSLQRTYVWCSELQQHRRRWRNRSLPSSCHVTRIIRRRKWGKRKRRKRPI